MAACQASRTTSDLSEIGTADTQSVPAICHHVCTPVQELLQAVRIPPGLGRCLVSLLVLPIHLWLGPDANGQTQSGSRDDYMSPQARTRVEALKAGAAQHPTDGSNLAERTPVLWRWINDYALAGGPVPERATGILQTAFRELLDAKRAGREPVVSLSQRPDGRAIYADARIDQVIEELRLKDERPGALGRFEVSSRGPFTADTWITVELTYTVGELALKQGGKVVVGRNSQWDRGDLQNDGPGDGYVTIKASKPEVRFVKVEIPRGPERYSAVGARPAFLLERGTLAQGDSFTLVYGDRTGGGRGWHIHTYENDLTVLPVYVDHSGDGRYPTHHWPAFEVAGAAAARVKGFAPSVVEPGEAFELAVRSEDVNFNRARSDIPAYRVSLNGEPFRDIPAGAPALNVLEDIRLDEQGVYRFGFASADGRITGSSNPVWVRSNPPHRIYWGETHSHAGLAEGQGSIDGAYRYARDDAQLDFYGMSDHDTAMDDLEWKNVREAVIRYSEPGRFIAFLGYEWTVQRRFGGHHNVFYRRPFDERVGAQLAPNLASLYQGLRERYDTNDVLIIPHAHQPGDWRNSDTDMESLVEIMSMHGTFEWFGNYYLRNGHQVGFVAASDDHRTHPGYTGTRPRGMTQFGGLAAALASEKTADAIFDALKQRRVYAATTAERIIVDLELNGAQMGRRIGYSDDRRLRARVMGTAPITEVAVVKNGDEVYRMRPLKASLADQVTAQITFESSSEPFIRDSPRGVRRWSGTIEVLGAAMAGYRAPRIENRHHERWEQEGDRIRFRTATRGRADSVLIDLEGATPSTQIVVSLDEGSEFGKAPIHVRTYRAHPARTLEFRFSDLRDGLLEEDLPADPDSDRVTLQLVSDDQPLDCDFEFVDQGAVGHGDYYYVRAKQLDGAMAWSSPVWVGGEEPR
ncbi:MAG: DUF3604 domain-containing protein [Acidobacteriia bacterium]|nr:DUF3604 domain-containing protein [Terriglobia bacterium]